MSQTHRVVQRFGWHEPLHTPAGSELAHLRWAKLDCDDVLTLRGRNAHELIARDAADRLVQDVAHGTELVERVNAGRGRAGLCADTALRFEQGSVSLQQSEG